MQQERIQQFYLIYVGMYVSTFIKSFTIYGSLTILQDLNFDPDYAVKSIFFNEYLNLSLNFRNHQNILGNLVHLKRGDIREYWFQTKQSKAKCLDGKKYIKIPEQTRRPFIWYLVQVDCSTLKVFAFFQNSLNCSLHYLRVH